MDDRIIKSGRQLSGIGGYLNPSQIDDFVNPPVPSNEAGIMDMARLLQQQRDTFGNMLTYPDPPDEGGGTGGGGTGGGTGGGGTGGGGGGSDDDDGGGSNEQERRRIIDELRRQREEDRMRGRVPPPNDFRFPPVGIPGIPIDVPGLPPMVPPRDMPIDLPIGLPPMDIPVPGGGGIDYGTPDSFTPLTRMPPSELPPSRDLIDYGFGPGIMPPTPDDFFIEEASTPPPPPPTVSRPTGLPSVELPRRLPVPRLPTGMETLVSPDIFINRNRRGRLR
jgi:hypothetical protein